MLPAKGALTRVSGGTAQNSDDSHAGTGTQPRTLTPPTSSISGAPVTFGPAAFTADDPLPGAIRGGATRSSLDVAPPHASTGQDARALALIWSNSA